MNNKKGFTLVELLAVLTLLAVLALIVYPAVEDYVISSRDKGNQTQVQNIISATKNWEADNPTQIPDLGESYTLKLGTLLDGGYIDDVIDYNIQENYSRETKIVITNNNGTYEYNVIKP